MRFALSLALAFGLAACGSVQRTFPPGMEPLEPSAPMPAHTGADYPEILSFQGGEYEDPVSHQKLPAGYGRAYIHKPLREVFQALRDPRTGWDSDHCDSMHVVAWQHDGNYPFTVRTEIKVRRMLMDFAWTIDWRHAIVEGTPEHPLRTSTRWQKIDGTSQIRVLEGAILARALPDAPEVTELEYQYHLAATRANQATIHEYLEAIYARALARSHGRPLPSEACLDCPPAPVEW